MASGEKRVAESSATLFLSLRLCVKTAALSLSAGSVCSKDPTVEYATARITSLSLRRYITVMQSARQHAPVHLQNPAQKEAGCPRIAIDNMERGPHLHAAR